MTISKRLDNFIKVRSRSGREDSVTEKLSTIKVVDYSDETGFEFGFVCELCGFEWRSERKPVVHSEGLGNLDEKDKELLRKADLCKAFEAAKEDAAIEFNKCPECGVWVCDECFYVADTELTDICNICVEEIR